MSKRILISDDDPAIVDSIRMLLEMEGYIVEVTVDGMTMATAQTFKPDLIFLDIWMSGQDGREIARELKSQPATRHIPIVMVSANRDAEALAKKAGADGFIAKPFEADDLLQIAQDSFKT